MNKAVLMGRLTADPEYHENGETKVAKYTLAVDRRTTKEDGTRDADFIRIVAFGKASEFARQYLTKGMKVLVTGRIQTGSYTDKNGNKVYTTDIIAEDQEFCEKKKAEEAAPAQTDANGFMNVPEGIEDELPFAKTGNKKK